MTRITGAIRGFAAFWWDFIVGDDWRIAAGVIAALVLTTAVAHDTGVPAWWLLPAAVPVVFGYSLWRAVRLHG